jgi:hypothetical protein
MIKMGDIENNERTIVITDTIQNGYENPTLEIINVDHFLGL